MLNKSLSNTFIRYIIVGLLSVGIDYGMLLIAYRAFEINLAAATTIGFLVGLVFNFLLTKFWTFATHETKHTAKQSAKQASMVAILVVFNLAVTNVVVVWLNELNVGPEISKILTTGMVTIWNYVLYKKLIFKQPVPAA